MKTKFLRILSIFACFIFFIVSPNVNNTFATWKIENDTLIIQNEKADHLSDNFDAEQLGQYTSLVVGGDMSTYDFSVLRSISYECKTIDLLHANTFTIPTGAFHAMGNLEHFVLPEKLEIVKRGAFAHCNNIRIDCLPPNLKVIEDCAFFYCQKLNFTIPKGVAVGTDSFKYCPNVHVHKSIPIDKNKVAAAPCAGPSLFSSILSLFTRSYN